MKSWARLILSIYFLVVVNTQIWAATPDGSSGPYADEVISFTQGKASDGMAVASGLSNSDSALGVPDDVAVSLGIGGTIVVSFDPSQAITSRVQLYEVSPGGDLLMERVAVFMSRDGATWFYADTENRSGYVDLPEELSCAVYVKLTDTTNVTDAESISDGYDVDALMADNAGYCEPLDPPAPTPISVPESVNPEATPTVTINPTSASPSEISLNQTTSTNQMTLAASSISCTVRDFQVQATLMHNNSPISQKLVIFSYAGTQKTATTDGNGKATVTLSYAGPGEVQVEAEGVNSKSFSITQLNCDETSSDTSVDSDSITTGRVLGASTERLAATGSTGYIQLFLLIAALTSAVSIGVMKRYHL